MAGTVFAATFLAGAAFFAGAFAAFFAGAGVVAFAGAAFLAGTFLAGAFVGADFFAGAGLAGTAVLIGAFTAAGAGFAAGLAAGLVPAGAGGTTNGCARSAAAARSRIDLPCSITKLSDPAENGAASYAAAATDHFDDDHDRIHADRGGSHREEPEREAALATLAHRTDYLAHRSEHG